MTVPAPRRAFTLLEMMAVVVLMLILLGIGVLTLAGSRDAVRVKRDAASMVAYMRNMWDYAKVSGSAVVLQPNFLDGTLTYYDPRSNRLEKAKLSSGARVLAIILNDRAYTAGSLDYLVQDGENAYMDEGSMPLYISEGRGLSRIQVLLGIPKEDSDAYDTLMLAKLSLITGRSKIDQIEEEALDEIMMRAADQDAEAAAEATP